MSYESPSRTPFTYRGVFVSTVYSTYIRLIFWMWARKSLRTSDLCPCILALKRSQTRSKEILSLNCFGCVDGKSVEASGYV